MAGATQGHAELNLEQRKMFRLLHAVNTVAPKALAFVLTHGSPGKDENMSYFQYLHDVLKLENHQWQLVRFFEHELEKLKISLTPESFDVTLLVKLIKVSCLKLAGSNDPVWKSPSDQSLEGAIMLIIKRRNSFFHDGCIKDPEILTDELENTLLKVVQFAGSKYEVDCSIVKSAEEAIRYQIEVIKMAPLSQAEISFAQMEALSQELRKVIATEGKKEIDSLISKWSYLEPMRLYGGDDRPIDVVSVYTPMKMAYDPTTFVEYTDVLSVPHLTAKKRSQSLQSSPTSSGSFKNITIIQGAAGSGKTTFLKLIGAVYIDASDFSIKGLSDYDLLLYTECRDSHLESIEDFLVRNFRNTAAGMETQDLVKVVLSFKLLILVDGLDELNSKSTALFRDLLEKTRNVDATIICTSRPRNIEWIRSVIPIDYNICKVTLSEIPDELRVEFLMKYYRQIAYLPSDSADITIPQDLVQSFERISEKTDGLCRYPLNLVMLCLIYLYDSDKLKEITTGTALYEQAMCMYEKKISKTLRSTVPEENLNSNIKEAMCAICQDALRALARGEIYLSDDSYEELKKVCTNKNLCLEPIISALLVLKAFPNECSKPNLHYFPHKGLQDFYAAKAIVESLKAPDVSSVTELSHFLSVTDMSDELRTGLLEVLTQHQQQANIGIRSTLMRLAGEEGTASLVKFQNVFRHVIGLLLENPLLFDQFAAETVDLLQEAGISNLHEWLEVILEANCDRRVARLASRKTSQREWRLSDGDLKAAAALLEYTCPSLVRLDLHGLLPKLKTSLPSILQALGKHKDCTLYLKVNHSFNEPNESCDELVKSIQGPSFLCKLEQFKGALRDTSILHRHSNTLDWLRLVLPDAASHTLSPLTSLRTLNIKMYAGCPVPAVHTPLPPSLAQPALGAAGFGVHVLLSDVGDSHVDWAVDVLKKLQPRHPYARVLLSRSALSTVGVSQLTKKLKENGVQISLRLDLHTADLVLPPEHLQQYREDVGCKVEACSSADQLVVGMSDPASHDLAHLPNAQQQQLVVYIQRDARLPDRPRPLPSVDWLTLRLWSVAGEEGCQWATAMAETLHPPHPYSELQLRDCQLTSGELHHLLHLLANRGVTVSRKIVVFSDHVTLMTDEVVETCRERLNCRITRLDKVHRPAS